MVYNFFDKKYKGSGVAMLQNQQLAEELDKVIIKKMKNEKKYIHLLKIIFGVLNKLITSIENLG